MLLALSAMLFQAAVAPNAAQPATSQPTTESAAAPAKESKICRDMLTSSSRVRPVRVCKTRAGWQRWQRCHSATRYCAPPRQETVTVASLPDDKLICKYIKETGSRIGQQKICATKRQWELTELETQETMRDRQNRSTLTGGSETMSVSPGQGPR
jgi:hypothetical protein